MSLPIIPIKLKSYFSENDTTNHITLNLRGVLVDSGTTANLIRFSSIIGTKFRLSRLPNPLNVTNALGMVSQNSITQYLTCNVLLEQDKVELINRKFYIVKNLEFDGIVGMDIIRGCKITFRDPIKIVTNHIRINPGFPDTCDIICFNNLATKNTQGARVVLENDIFLCPYESKYVKIIVKGKLDQSSGKAPKTSIKTKEKCCYYLNPLKSVSRFCTVPTRMDSARNLLFLTNNSDKVIAFSAGITLANVSDPSPEYELFVNNYHIISNLLITAENLSESDLRIHNDEIKHWKKYRGRLTEKVSITGDINAILKTIPVGFQAEIKCLLEKFHFIFRRNKDDAGLNQTFLVDLMFKNPNDQTPIFRRNYKIDEKLVPLLDQKIKGMEDSGILEMSSSSYILLYRMYPM